MAQPIPPPPHMYQQMYQPRAPVQQPNNGSTSWFQGLTSNNTVLSSAYDFTKAFQRSVKVFLMSYPEIDMVNSPQYHKQKFQEYVTEMMRLYNQRQPDMSFLQQMNTDIQRERLQIFISCKQVIGRENLINPTLVATFMGHQVRKDIDMSCDELSYNPMRIAFAFNSYLTLRTDISKIFVLSIEENHPMVNLPLPEQHDALTEFDLICAHTHPEGFEDWVDFGRGVRLLINVFYRVENEPNITPEEVSTFHLRTIELMLRRRLHVYSTTTGALGRPHRKAAQKHKVCYQRQYINKQTDSYFWIRPEFGTTPSWFYASDAYISPRKTTVRSIDMQIGFETNQDFEDRVCLCNEWCNWNAFFYYNPIYRFLLVRHHQLYIKNMSNIPDMYLCLTVLFGCAPTATIKKPVLSLMYCANEYRKRYYDLFYLKSRNNTTYQQNYAGSYPHAKMMNGLTYNKLRNELNITEVCHLLDPNPFADNCIESLIHYYDVLIDLHLYLSSDTLFVNDTKRWSADLDVLGRNKYSDYIKHSYDKCCAQLTFGNDLLFTEDFEYSTQLSKTADIQEIRKVRERVKVSPLNVSIRTSDFLTAFASVYKFLARVEPSLPSTYKKEGRILIMNCYRQMDTDFDDFTNTKAFDYWLDSTRSGFNNLEQNFDVFYTLKLYFYAFEIQKHCINAVLKANSKVAAKTHQVATLFTFIWDNETIEGMYANNYPGEVLFVIKNFVTIFDEFYERFWGRAQHERAWLHDRLQIADSGHFMLQKLYFWLRNDGNNKRKFVKIIESFNNSLKDILDMSDRLIINWIMGALVHLNPTYMYTTEVFDHLVYYVVKANCSVILSTVAMFFKPMHDLQTDQLVATDVSYSLCKPGWVPLFNTLTSVLTALDRLRTEYIVFDDEFDRISNTINQTKQMIKDIYRQFYAKLSYEWLRELTACFVQIGAPTPNVTEFVQLHLAVGLSFVAFFCDTFRQSFAYTRKVLFRRLNFPPSPHLSHLTAFTLCIQTVENYLKDRQQISSAQPFNFFLWRQRLNQIITSLNQLSGQQLNIDLNAANV